MIIGSLGRLGILGANRKMQSVTLNAVQSLEEIDLIITKRTCAGTKVELSDSNELQYKIIVKIYNIGEEILRRLNTKNLSDDRYAICEPIISLKQIGENRASYERFDGFSKIISFIGNIGYSTVKICTDENGFERPLRDAIDSLETLGIISANCKLIYPTNEAIAKIGDIIEISLEKNLDQTTTNSTSSIYHIYGEVEKNQELALSQEQFTSTLIQLVCKIREREIENELSKQYGDKFIKSLKKIKKENISVFTRTITKCRSNLSHPYVNDREKVVFENLLEEIDKKT
jgi:hypothetical protein